MARELFSEAYYLNPYLEEMRAEIEAVFPYEEGVSAVICKDTCFYPEGGGQPGDRGELIASALSYEVLDTQRRAGEILHLVRGEGPEPGQEAVLRIDWERRFDFMQQHSGEHLISGLCHALKGYDNVGFHINEETMVIDFNGELTPAELQQIEDEANAAVWLNEEIEVLFPSPEEAQGLDYRSKKDVGERLRLIKVGGYDLCACCGTQVRRTGEIGLIRLRQMQRHRGGVRIQAYCGRRALQMAQRESALLDELVRTLSEPPEKLVAAVQDRLDKLTEARLALREFTFEHLQREAARYVGEAAALLEASDLDKSSAKDLAKDLSQHFPHFVMLAQRGEEGGRPILNITASRSPESPVDFDLTAVLAQLKEDLSLRGGGQPAFVQARIDCDFETLRAELVRLGHLSH